MIVPPPPTLVQPPGPDKRRAPRSSAWVAAVLAAVLAVAAVGCGRREHRDQRVRLPVDVASDTSRSVRLTAPDSALLPAPPAHAESIPRASVWLTRVSPTPAARLEPSVDAGEPQTGAWPEPPALEVDEGLKPPIARGSARLTIPRGAHGGWVELDVRVDETGAVSDVEWAGGAIDSARVEAATACAFAMRYFPALQDGRAVAVWCRQRFDFGR